MARASIPTFEDLMNPLLRALRALGGSGSIDEIYSKTIEIAGLSEGVRAHFMIQTKGAKRKSHIG